MKLVRADTTADSLIGYAKVNTGYEPAEIQKKSRIGKTTFYNRLKRPEELKLEELRQLIRICHYTDEQIVEIVKGGR